MVFLTNRLRPDLGSALVSRPRKIVALLVAGLADLLQLVLFPMFVEGALSPLDWAVDGVIVVALTLVLGFKWRILLGLGVELIPGLDLFPTWTALVLSIPSAPSERGGGAREKDPTIEVVTLPKEP